jgi:O-antigen/teichoic acid export membrane protein
MANKANRAFIKSTGIVTLSQGGALVTSIVTGILTARYLGPEGKGQLALALGTGMILGQILCLGFNVAAPYFLASSKLGPGKVLGSWIVTLVMGSVFAYCIVYPIFFRFLMDNVFTGVGTALLFFGSLACPLYMLRLLINSIMAGYEEFTKQIYHNILIYLASIAAAVLVLAVLHMGPLEYAQIQIGLGFLTLIGGFVLLRKVIILRPEFSLSAWLKMLCYGIKGALTQVLNLIDLRLDIFIVNYFTENALVGVYTIAGGLANMFWILPKSIGVVLLPRTAGSDKEEANKRTSLLCRNVLWLTSILGGLFLLISRRLITFVYTERFADASLAVAFLMPGVVGQAVSRICFTDCLGRGHPGKATIAAAITATITVIFDILLIPKYSMYGAAVASSIAYCTSGVLGIYWHIKLSGNSLGRLVIPRASDLKYYRDVFNKIKAKFTR